MKVLFIYPNVGSQVGFNYGISHMSSVLKHGGHEVECWQICESLDPLPTCEEFAARLQEIEPDLVGFSVVTNQWPYAKRLASWARETVSAPLIIGGIHATAATRQILDTGLFDYVFRGECDEAILEFADMLSRGEDVACIRNVALVRDKKVIINPVRPFPVIRDLPVKEYQIFDFQRVINAKDGWVGLIASRGCPFSCTYCLNHQIKNQYKIDLNCSLGELNFIRHLDVGQVIGEIEFLLNTYKNIKTFIFDDDLFTFSKEYVREFCKAYKKVCSIPFVVNAHFHYFDEDRARYLAAANCKIVKFGIESGNERIRKEVLNRRMSNQLMMDKVEIAERQGLHASVFIMIGLPYETMDDVIDTVRLTAQARPGRFRWTKFFPYPGTKAAELSVQGGYVDFDKMENLMNFTDESCLDFGTQHNLFLEKVGQLFPWFVNAYSGLSVAPFYERKMKEVLAMDRYEWGKISPGLLDEDKRISRNFVDRRKSHYAFKYNTFTGVISDYFTAEG